MLGKQHREGFTLMELMISIGVIGVLAGITISSLNIRAALIGARDVERQHNAAQVQRAMFQYLVDEARMPSNTIQEGPENALPICKAGVSEADCLADGNVSLHEIVPGYIGDIPEDPIEPCEKLTGYKVYKTAERPRVFSVYLGMLLGDPVESFDCDNPLVSTTTTATTTTTTTTTSSSVGGSSSTTTSSSTSTTTTTTTTTTTSSSSSSVPAPSDCSTAPLCDGQVATICVIGGIIVGGPDDGDPYVGVLQGGNGDDIIVGTSGDDIIDGGNAGDTICGLAGDDILTGGGNAKDIICGGDGDDTLSGANGQDELDGGAGTDSVDGGSAPDDCANGESYVSCETVLGSIAACN